jgi:hypothetical protein
VAEAAQGGADTAAGVIAQVLGGRQAAGLDLDFHLRLLCVAEI